MSESSSAGQAVTRAVAPEDVTAVADFFHARLNRRVPSAQWRLVLDPPWGAIGPHRGYALWSDGEVVGAYACVYSRRSPDGPLVCNLAAFCVLPAYRMHSVRLLRSVLADPQAVFTDLSPSGNVVAINERLKFRLLPTDTRLVMNLPAPTPRGLRVTDSATEMTAVLDSADTAIFHDHAGAATRSLTVIGQSGYAFLAYRRDKRKGLPLFASPLYVGGDRDLLARSWGAVRGHLLRRGFAATLAEKRVLGFIAGPGWTVRNPRPRMVRGDVPDDLDYMYSELALIEW